QWHVAEVRQCAPSHPRAQVEVIELLVGHGIPQLRELAGLGDGRRGARESCPSRPREGAPDTDSPHSKIFELMDTQAGTGTQHVDRLGRDGPDDLGYLT